MDFTQSITIIEGTCSSLATQQRALRAYTERNFSKLKIILFGCYIKTYS